MKQRPAFLRLAWSCDNPVAQQQSQTFETLCVIPPPLPVYMSPLVKDLQNLHNNGWESGARYLVACKDQRGVQPELIANELILQTWFLRCKQDGLPVLLVLDTETAFDRQFPKEFYGMECWDALEANPVYSIDPRRIRLTGLDLRK